MIVLAGRPIELKTSRNVAFNLNSSSPFLRSPLSNIYNHLWPVHLPASTPVEYLYWFSCLVPPPIHSNLNSFQFSATEQKMGIVILQTNFLHLLSRRHHQHHLYWSTGIFLSKHWTLPALGSHRNRFSPLSYRTYFHLNTRMDLEVDLSLINGVCFSLSIRRNGVKVTVKESLNCHM